MPSKTTVARFDYLSLRDSGVNKYSSSANRIDAISVTPHLAQLINSTKAHRSCLCIVVSCILCVICDFRSSVNDGSE